MVVNQTLAEGSLSSCQFKASVQCVILSFCRPHENQYHTSQYTADCRTQVSGHIELRLQKITVILWCKSITYIYYKGFSPQGFLEQLSLLILSKLERMSTFTQMIQEVDLKWMIRQYHIWTSLKKNFTTARLYYFPPPLCTVFLSFIIAPTFPCDCCVFFPSSQKENTREKALLDPSLSWGLCYKSTERRNPTCLWSCLWAVDRRWNTTHNHT